MVFSFRKNFQIISGIILSVALSIFGLVRAMKVYQIPMIFSSIELLPLAVPLLERMFFIHTLVVYLWEVYALRRQGLLLGRCTAYTLPKVRAG